MNTNKGFSVIVAVFIVAAVAIITAVSGYFYLDFGGPNEPQKSPKEQIQEVLMEYSEETGTEMTLSHISSKFARGESGKPGTESYKTAVFTLIGNEWKMVGDVSDVIFCEKMERIGVPASIVSDCILEYPDAKTVAEVLTDIKNKGNSDKDPGGNFDENDQTEIIGIISFPDNPACNDCVQITSGGETIDVVLDPSDDGGDIDSGDTVVVVVDIIPDDDDADDDDGSNVVVTDIEEVGDDDGSSSDSGDGPDDSADDSDDSDDSGDTDDGDGGSTDNSYDITDLPPGIAPPGTDPPGSDSFYDVDNSNSLIKIISDF